MVRASETDSPAAALASGNWLTAREGFEAALARQESPEALFGLGTALWWLGETQAAVQAQERAYVAFRARQDLPSAALAAMSVCLTYRASLGNYAASRGWVARLARLVDEHDMAPMRGWLALCRAVAANDANDSRTAEARATEALGAARLTGDTDLELCALSEAGYALMQTGRVGEGTALLDEAMAGALAGEARQLTTVVFTACRAIVSCSRALEVERAVQWIRAAEPFTQRYGAIHLYTTCRTHYGSVLFGQGKWDDAERELREALRIGRAAEPALYGEALAKLAEVRVGQGRLSEAVRLLEGFEDHPAATYPQAQVLLRRGEPQVAAVTLDRRLDDFGEESLQVAALCELRAETDLALGNPEDAAARAARLVERGNRGGCAVMVARGERVYGHALSVAGDREAAGRRLDRALDLFSGLGLPYEAARVHLLLSSTHGEVDRGMATVEARAALKTFETLGAATDADEAAALLRRLGVAVVRGGFLAKATLSRRELEVLALIEQGMSNRDIADRLFLSRKTVEHHVRSLVTKLGVANRTEAAAYAVRHDLVGDSAKD